VYENLVNLLVTMQALMKLFTQTLEGANWADTVASRSPSPQRAWEGLGWTLWCCTCAFSLLRVDNLVAFLTSHTYTQVAQGLYHMDRLLFAFFIAVGILRQNGLGPF
jgi:hypothetical protein